MVIISDQIQPSLNYYMAALEDNATTPNGSVYKGESVLFRLDITPLENLADRMVVKFLTPSNDTQPMTICGMNLVHTGANVVCHKRGSLHATLESRYCIEGFSIQSIFVFSHIKIHCCNKMIMTIATYVTNINCMIGKVLL